MKEPATFTFSDAQLGALFDQIPALAGQPREITELSGGLTNRNLKVTTPEGMFVARCSDPDGGAALGIDRMPSTSTPVPPPRPAWGRR